MTWNIEQAQWLVGEEGRAWLARLAEAPADPVRLLTTLRKDLSADRASAVVEQLELRRRARAKFARADEMFFTQKSCEQASDEAVARYKARRFPVAAALLDLCCGIGGDSLALAERGRCAAVDNDRVVALFAQANAQLAHNGKLMVVVGDAEECDPSLYAAWHIDPDRRAEGKRTTTAALFAPDAEAVAVLLAKNGSAAIKLAPASDLPENWPLEVEREWLSRVGECRQQVAWFGELSQVNGTRRATMVSSQGEATRTIVGNEHLEIPLGALGQYIYEPDAAVLASRLTGQLAQECNLTALATGIAYLTGDQLHHDPALAAFEVQEAMPLDLKRLKAWLKSRNVGRVEVKSRDPRTEANHLARQLSSQGDERATVLVYPHQKSARAIIANRLP